MTKYLFALALLAAAGSARAADPTTYASPTRVAEPSQKVAIAKSSVTIQGISISSQPATNVIVDNTQMYSQICVQNFDTSAFLACSENVNVSTQTSSNQVGAIIAPALSASAPSTPVCFPVLPGGKFYCMSSSVTASTRAGTTRVR